MLGHVGTEGRQPTGAATLQPGIGELGTVPSHPVSVSVAHTPFSSQHLPLLASWLLLIAFTLCISILEDSVWIEKQKHGEAQRIVCYSPIPRGRGRSCQRGHMGKAAGVVRG